MHQSKEGDRLEWLLIWVASGSNAMSGVGPSGNQAALVIVCS